MVHSIVLHPSQTPALDSTDSSAKTSSQPWRLRKHADYQKVYKCCRKQQSSSMAYFATNQVRAATGNDWPSARVGLTAGRVLGNAVERNRIKRRMREAVKANLHLLPLQADVILHPRRQVLTAEFGELKREVGKIFGMVASRLSGPPGGDVEKKTP